MIFSGFARLLLFQPQKLFGNYSRLGNVIQWQSLAVNELFLRPIRWASTKVWDHGTRNYIDICLDAFCLHFRDAIGANNYAVVGDCSAPECLGCYGDNLVMLPRKRFTTSSAPRHSAISATLSLIGITRNSACKLHSDSPPSDDWQQDEEANSCFYRPNDKWTGIRVSKVYHLPVYQGKCIAKVIMLKHPSFRIHHFIVDEAHGIRDTLDIVEAPTVEKAKEIAEWYYKEWLKVNQGSK